MKNSICEDYAIYYVFFLHFSFVTLQKYLDPEFIVICGNDSKDFPFLPSHLRRLKDYNHEANFCNPILGGICPDFSL